MVGIKNLIFFDNRDSELSAKPKTVKELIDILGDIKPEAVFLPFMLDNHPDHMATSRIFYSAIKECNRTFMCYTWGIWTPLPYFNLAVDITPYVDLKRKALEAHRSQTDVFDVVGATLGLGRYYHVFSGGKGNSGWAEVYLASPSDEFIRLGEAIHR